MSATICAFILTFSTICGSRVVSGDVGRPRNVSLTSHNLDLVLRWVPPEGAADDVVYTVEYNSTVYPYRQICSNSSSTECDFSKDRHIYGSYTGRVRAELGNESSDWVQSNTITPDRDTVISPPSVTLFPNSLPQVNIEVSITDPVFTTSSLRDVYPFASYTIQYWKADKEEEVKTLRNLQQTRVSLDSLDPHTKYCVKVQIEVHRNGNPSEPSAPVCESTTNAEKPPWEAAAVTFVLIAMALSLVVVTVVYRKRISHFLCPKDTLPQHFKEYLLAPPKSSIYLAMRNSHPPEEIYHQVSIITDGKTVDEGRPLEVAGSGCSRQPNITAGER